MPNTRVVVIADNLLARVGLSALLDGKDDIDVVGQLAGTDDPTFVDDLDLYNPDVVVFDLGYDPLTLISRLNALLESEFPLLALMPDSEFASSVIAVLRSAPTYGLLYRESDVALLHGGIKAMMSGLVVLEPELASIVLPESESAIIEPLTDDLTPRESEVLQLLAQGLTNKGIGQELGISPNTVKFHINAILNKFNAQSRTEAVVKASRLGLLIL